MCCSDFKEKKESSLPGVSHRRETMMFLQSHREASVSGELSTLTTRTSLIPTVTTSCQMQRKEAWWGIEWGGERRILTKLKMRASSGSALELGSHLGTWAVLDSGDTVACFSLAVLFPSLSSIFRWLTFPWIYLYLSFFFLIVLASCVNLMTT